MMEKTYQIVSPDGRIWEIKLSSVAEDYANFLVEQDQLTKSEALEKAWKYPDFLDTWFHEQFLWEDIFRIGTLIRDYDPQKVPEILDFYLLNFCNSPQSYTEIKS